MHRERRKIFLNNGIRSANQRQDVYVNRKRATDIGRRIHIVMINIHVYMRARSRSLDPRLSAPRNYQGRPSPRQFVKAVIIPADLWHCIHCIGRCLPPDQITSPGRSPGRTGPVLSWVPSPGPMKTIHFESAAHYHRLGFDARLKLKRIDTRMDTLIYRKVYKYSFFPSSLSHFLFSHSRSSFLTRGTEGRYVPTCVIAVLRNTYVRERERERLPSCNLYD